MPRVAVPLAVALLMAVGCQRPPPPTQPGPPDVDITLADSLDVIAAAGANNKFGFDLYQQLNSSAGNLVYSPCSIYGAMAMTCGGAAGQTEEEMAKALHFTMPKGRQHLAVGTLQRRLSQTDQDRIYHLSLVNALWAQKGLGFLPEFTALARTRYSAELQEVDFKSNSDQARQIINAWVQKQTQGKIREIMPPGVLSAKSGFVLANAIYFKGSWASKFRKEHTTKQPFRLTAEKSIEVPMMRQQGKFWYSAAEGIQVLKLPYHGKDVSMLILLPDAVDGLAALEKRLSVDTLGKMPGGREREVMLVMPRFNAASEFSLAESLQNLGIKQAFDPATADFSALAKGAVMPLLHVLHRAAIEVNEEGAEASAAAVAEGDKSAAGNKERDLAVTFHADHPFLFVLRDNRTNTVFFIGRVAEPKGD